MKWGRGAALSGLAMLVVAASSTAMAQVTKVSMKLKDADMLTATRTLTSKTGIQFVVEPSIEPFKKITLEVSDATPEEMIRYICQAAGAEFRRDERGVFIIGHSKPTLAPELLPNVPVVKTEPHVFRKIRILKASASDIYDLFVRNEAFSQTKSFEELKRFANMTTRDQQRIFGANTQFQGNGFTQTFAPVGATPVSAPALAPGETSGQKIIVPEAAGQGFPGGGGGGFQGGRGGGGGGNGLGGGQGLGGNQGGGGQGGNAQLTGGTGLVPEGIDFVSYDPTDNSLIVQGTEEAIQELQTRIGLFDNAPRQILIKVEFITTTETVDRSFGTEFLYQRGTLFTGTRPGSFVRSGDPVFLNYASGNVTGRLRASLVEGRGKVVSAPIVRTMNNQPASITAIVSQYIFINQLAATGNVVVNVPTPFLVQAQTGLTVAPRINDDNTITLFLNPQISAFVGTSTSPDGQEIPNQTFQTLAVVARVRNGETMVLGGLTSKNEDNSVNRVPVLSELPIIGQFFRTNNKSKVTSELLIFVTPTIVDEDTTGSPGQP